MKIIKQGVEPEVETKPEFPLNVDLECMHCHTVYQVGNLTECANVTTERCINGDMRVLIFCPTCHEGNVFSRKEYEK